MFEAHTHIPVYKHWLAYVDLLFLSDDSVTHRMRAVKH